MCKQEGAQKRNVCVCESELGVCVCVCGGGGGCHMIPAVDLPQERETAYDIQRVLALSYCAYTILT